MEIESAANFLAGTILVGIGSIVIICVVVTINNILHKYWKPVTLGFYLPNTNVRFIEPEVEKTVEPKLDEKRDIAEKSGTWRVG